MRSTYAHIDALTYRLRAAVTLLGVSDNTLRSYADTAGIFIKRGSDLKLGAPAVRVFEPETLFKLAAWRRAKRYIRGPRQGSGPVVITVDVVKGGTGKATTAVELTLHLQLMGLRTILIDLDSQAHATRLMGYEPDLTLDEASEYQISQDAIVEHTFADLLTPYIQQGIGSDCKIAAPTEGLDKVIKKPFGEAGPHLIPADIDLCDLESAIDSSTGPRELYVRQFIAAASAGNVPSFDGSAYDVIIFDCPPHTSYISSSATAAADFVVAPIRLDAFAIKGLSQLMEKIKKIHHLYGLAPELVILPTHYTPQIALIGRMQKQLNQYRDMLAPGVIPLSEDFPKSWDQYLPLSLQKPTSNPAQEYRMFAEHMLSKILAFTNDKARKLNRAH